MGKKLTQFYEEAKELGGLKAKMRLAMITLMPGAQAKVEPDSPENIKKFQEAMKEIRKEFK
jgi:phage-related protein